MINSFKVGYETTWPDWFVNLLNENTIITHKKPHEQFASSASVQTTYEGIQVAQKGDYIKQYPDGMLRVERVPAIKVNESMFAVHSSPNGMNN